MSDKPLKIAKALKEVAMWVHPEGLVKGSIFVTVGEETGTQEDPAYVLNESSPFLVLKRNEPDELRFYNRASIVRVEYDSEKPVGPKFTTLACRVSMMDGSVIDGEIVEVLPTDRARLYDYLNQGQDRFVRLHTSNDEVCMVNKSYIIQITSR